jgi:hypothetical protein
MTIKTPDQVYDLILDNFSDDEYTVDYKFIPEIATLTGWAQSSIKLILDLDLWLTDRDAFTVVDVKLDIFDNYTGAPKVEEDAAYYNMEREEGDPKELDFN